MLPANTKLTAKRITQENQQSQQLATFVASLGVSQSLELYSCNDQVYINADVILPVLSVDIKWFHKNAEIPTHYIILNKITYINRYGMTKLLGQSKQPAAFRLQDYLYELFYRVETEGIVDRDSVVSRKRLLALNDQVDIYRDIIEKNQTAIAEAKELANAAFNDYTYVEQENVKLLKQIAQLELSIKEGSEDLDTYKFIANKLARYVRVKSKAPPDEAYSDALDIEDEEDPSDLSVVADAIKAKSKLQEVSKVRSKSISKPIARTNSATEKNTLYLMRSVNPADNDLNYHWSLIDIEPSEELLTQSEEYLSGEIDRMQSINLCYRTMIVSNDRRNAMILFLDLVNNITDESTIEKLISF